MHYFGHLSENEQLSFAKATQLPAFLENEKQLLDQEKKQLHHNHMLRDKQFTQLYEVKCLYWLLFYLMLTISLIGCLRIIKNVIYISANIIMFQSTEETCLLL